MAVTHIPVYIYTNHDESYCCCALSDNNSCCSSMTEASEIQLSSSGDIVSSFSPPASASFRFVVFEILSVERMERSVRCMLPNMNSFNIIIYSIPFEEGGHS